MLTDKDCKKMMNYFILALKNDFELQDVVAKAISRTGKPARKLVSTKVAAEMVGISPWQLYRIKDDENGRPRFSYVKSGSSKSSTLKFNANTLLDEYSRYIAERRNTPHERPVNGSTGMNSEAR